MPAAGWRSLTYANTSTINSNYIFYNTSIPANSTITIKNPYTLTNPGGIKVTSTNGTCTFNTFGTEVS
jgi:hypothetical protein